MSKSIRCIALLLALMICAPFVSAENPNILFYEQSVSGILEPSRLASVDDMLFISNSRGLYRSDPQGQLIRLFSGAELGNSDALVSDGSRLYSICFYEGVIREIVSEVGSYVLRETLQLQYGDLADGKGYLLQENRPRTVSMVGKWLCLLTAGNKLLTFNMETGLYDEHEVSNLIWIAAGPEDHSLLMLQLDNEAMMDNHGERQLSLSKLDVASGLSSALGSFYLPVTPDIRDLPFICDWDNQNLYIAVSKVLYRISFADFTKTACAWLPDSLAGGLDQSTNPLSIYSNQKIAIVTGFGIITKDGSQNELPPTTLTLATVMSEDYFDDSAARRAALNLPSLRIEQKGALVSVEELFLSVLGQSPDLDFFLLNTDHVPLDSMIEKGYLLNISQRSDDLRKWADTLSPLIRASTLKDGELFCVPIELEFNTWLARKDILTSLGLKAPADFITYCRFLTDWYENADEWDKWSPFPYLKNARLELLRIAYDLYVQYMRGSGQALDFDTPLFRRMMESASSVQFGNKENAGNNSVEFDEIDDGMRFTIELINHKAAYSPELEHFTSSETGMTEYPLEMSADADIPAYQRGNLLVLAVNPYSSHVDESIAYLEEYVQSMDPLTQNLLLIDLPAADIPNPNYDRYVERAEDALKAKQACPLPADANEKYTHEQEIERLQEELQWTKDNTRFLLTKEEAQRVKERVSKVYIRDTVLSPEYTDNLLSLLERYASGSYPLDHLVQEANSIIRLIEAELGTRD